MKHYYVRATLNQETNTIRMISARAMAVAASARRVAMTLLLAVLTTTVGAETVTLKAGDGTGSDIVFDSYYNLVLISSYKNAKEGDFWYEGDDLWFMLPDYPDTFTAPDGYEFDGWIGQDGSSPGRFYQVNGNQIFTAHYCLILDASFTLSPASMTITEATTDVDISMDVVWGKFNDDWIADMLRIIFDENGTLSNGTVDIPFKISDRDFSFFPDELTKTIRITIEQEAFDALALGTYTGTLNYQSRFWDYSRGSGGYQKYPGSGSISVTLKVGHTITFDYGNESTSTVDVKRGGVVSEPAVQFYHDADNNKDYCIEGWYTDQAYTVAYDFTTPVDHSFTLYAKWVEAGHYTLSANVGGTVTLTDAKERTPNGDGLFIPGSYTLTVTPASGKSFELTSTLMDRRTGAYESLQPYKGNTMTTWKLDLTEKDAGITVTFSSNPIVSVTTTTDGTAKAGTYSMVDGHGTMYLNGSTVTVNEAVSNKDAIELTVTKGNGVGCAVTIVNNGRKTINNVNQDTYSFTPEGNVNIEIFFYDMTAGVLSLLSDDSGAAEGSKNVDLISAANGGKRMVTLSGRTLYRDGDWNTICLPFDFDIAGSELDKTGVTLMELDTENAYSGHVTGFDEGTLYLNFKDAGKTIKAGKPYIIKWKKPSNNNSSKDIFDPKFGAVTIKAGETTVVSADGKVSFVGSFSPVGLKANDKSVLYLGAGNTLYWPSAAKDINSFRAYFQLNNGLTAGDPAPTGGGDQGGQLVRAFNLNFGEEGETTGIFSATLNDKGQMINDKWYTIDGRKLSGKPTKKGLYINNGRKVVIK